MRPETKRKMGKLVHAIPQYFHRYPDMAVACMRCESGWVELETLIWANQHGRFYLTKCPVCGYRVLMLFDCIEQQDYWVVTLPNSKHIQGAVDGNRSKS